uniref:hypothetical protein n=1 Tax=Eubacterium cellulosolvens TaxID=29322 RepID=UPI0006873981|nr:hypothetical protein [[Eubacterium] cellulosolvens]
MDGNTIIVYKPLTNITEENKNALQFLDLMSVLDRYSESNGMERNKKLKKYVKQVGLNFSEVKKYLPLYPDRV